MAKGAQSPDAIMAIVEKVQGLKLTDLPAWSDLDVLSQRTRLDGIEVDPAGVRLKGVDFDGLASVYVVLEYGEKNDRFTTSDAFRGKFSGHISGGKPVIDNFTVDTAPFYAGEELVG